MDLRHPGQGHATSSTTYYNGSAYTDQIVGYNTFGLPTGTKTIIPSAEGALAGTYTTGDTYDPDTMQLTSLYQSAAGGLPAETVTTGYDTAGDPVSVGSSLWTYATSVSYTEYASPCSTTSARRPRRCTSPTPTTSRPRT